MIKTINKLQETKEQNKTQRDLRREKKEINKDLHKHWFDHVVIKLKGRGGKRIK